MEELFTQCSQNLFIKRPLGDPATPRRAGWSNAWDPGLRLERLFEAQFEILQATVSTSGLPGASPRNGDRGKAAYVGRLRAKTFVLIPYFSANAVHGHAAKLWSNPRGQLVIWDDHGALSAVSITGPSWTVRMRPLKGIFRQSPTTSRRATNATEPRRRTPNIGSCKRSLKSCSSPSRSSPIRWTRRDRLAAFMRATCTSRQEAGLFRRRDAPTGTIRHGSMSARLRGVQSIRRETATLTGLMRWRPCWKRVERISIA